MTQDFGQNKNSELKEAKKIKVAQLHKNNLKQLLNVTLTPKITHFGKRKKQPKN